MVKTWDEMTPRKKDALVAEKVMGDIRDSGGSWMSHDGSKITCADNGPKYYTADHDAARLVEDEIERQHIVFSYINELAGIVVADSLMKPHSEVDILYQWLLIRATPDQRCYAALKALNVL